MFRLASAKKPIIQSISSRGVHSKVFPSAAAAVKASGLKDGDTLLSGGFGLCGIPQTTIEAIHATGVTNLTVVSNNCGVDGWGLGVLLNDKRIKRIVASYVGENAEFERQYVQGELEFELTPQGTLAEKLRSGGAGIPAFFTPTAAGTIMAEGKFPIKYKPGSTEVEIYSTPKEVRDFNGRPHVLEESIRGEVAIVKAWKVDEYGNMMFRGTARNFNPDVATAGRFTIVEADEIVPIGSLNPEEIHLSGGYVHAVVKTEAPKKIERLTLAPKPDAENKGKENPAALIRDRIARRASLEFKNHMKVNLGIGIPTLIPSFLPSSMSVDLQSENGLLGMGGYAADENSADPDLINASKETISLATGASIFSSSESFGMIRGGHVDLTVLGAMEVDQEANLANFMIPQKLVKGIGGAGDLVASPSKVIVIMEHNNKRGDHKILKQCKLPLTGKKCVDKIISELAVFDVDKENNTLVLVEKIDDVTVDEIRERTGADFVVSDNLITYRQ